jgi:tRNA-splicing ligase RtcB (3'-phosphate/5'-hydroxy nucleic acid ligase)
MMDTNRLTRVDATTWRIEPHGTMRVPAVIYADENLIRDMDDKVYEQAANVATLPGIVQASYAMPDAHWGYGFPIGGVAAFDPDKGGVVSAGGVGFDISCGVRTMLTCLKVSDVLPVQQSLADSLFRQIPAGVGSRGPIISLSRRSQLMRINPSFAQQGSSRSSLKSAANAPDKPLLYGVVQQFHVTRSRSNFAGSSI